MSEVSLYAHSPGGLCLEPEPHPVMLSDQNTCFSHGGGACMAAVFVVTNVSALKLSFVLSC